MPYAEIAVSLVCALIGMSGRQVLDAQHQVALSDGGVGIQIALICISRIVAATRGICARSAAMRSRYHDGWQRVAVVLLYCTALSAGFLMPAGRLSATSVSQISASSGTFDQVLISFEGSCQPPRVAGQPTSR